MESLLQICVQHVAMLYTTSRSEWSLGLTADEATDNGHAVGGQRAGLVGTNRRSVAHCLTGVQMSHQVVIGHHPLQTPQTHTRHKTTGPL